MTIQVKVIARASTNGVSEHRGVYVVHVTAPPADGKANEAAIDLLADFFHVAKSRITIVRGETSRHKTVEIA